MDVNFKEVHSDDRRRILANDTLLGGREVSIIDLKKGKAIGGCMHSEDEFMFILDGYVLCNFGSGWELKKEGFGFVIPAGTPHAFMAPMEDCLIIESGLTREQKEHPERDYELKEEVDLLNAKD